MTKKSNEIDELKLFIAKMMGEEQKKHSILLNDLKLAIGKTKEFDSTSAILSQIFDAKMDILEKIYRKINGG